ncbi:MAG TPA: hypothetical protein VF742_15410, partial [Terracidiphilus sp.]
MRNLSAPQKYRSTEIQNWGEKNPAFSTIVFIVNHSFQMVYMHIFLRKQGANLRPNCGENAAKLHAFCDLPVRKCEGPVPR